VSDSEDLRPEDAYRHKHVQDASKKPVTVTLQCSSLVLEHAASPFSIPCLRGGNTFDACPFNRSDFHLRLRRQHHG
jgi:hypothetical protein